MGEECHADDGDTQRRGKGLGYLRRWRYVPDGPRDLRIDFMRGMALMLMIVTHVEIISVFNLFTSERFGFTTGAEIFVILSGFVLGQTKRRQLQHSDMATVSYSLLRRAATLYAVNIVIIVSVLALSQLPWLNSFEVTHFTQRHDELIYSLYPIAAQSREAWFNQILFLQIGPQQTQIRGSIFICCWEPRWWCGCCSGDTAVRCLLFRWSCISPTSCIP
ncbi:OpgC domain-containing protein [Edwardsiella anguillarum]|nr:OpgC domain-containing protein [Edwardsiella anguillarum]